MLEQITNLDWIERYALPWGINFLFALGIFVAGRWLARGIVALIKRLLARGRFDPILANFVTSILNGVLLLVVVIAALDRLGVNTTSLVALIGAAGLAIGLALQDSLKNFAAGVMLIVFRPFKAGDFVEAGGTQGVVERINIFSSTFSTPDNREIIVPNGAIYAGVITNYSARPRRRIDLVFGIGYEDDLREAKRVLRPGGKMAFVEMMPPRRETLASRAATLALRAARDQFHDLPALLRAIGIESHDEEIGRAGTVHLVTATRP